MIIFELFFIWLFSYCATNFEATGTEAKIELKIEPT
jgi:hypothetical protein